MKAKKMVAVLTSVVLGAGALSGCQTTEQTANGGQYALTEVTTADTYPLETDVTLRYWMTVASGVLASQTSFNTTPLKGYLEENTGIKLEFEHPVVGQENEGFNILLASDDMPDIIEWDWVKYPGGPEKAIADDLIIPLNSYIENVSPNFRKLLEEHPDWAVQAMTDEGNYYYYPFIVPDDVLSSYVTFIIRKDLLDKAGLPVPETLDEWETALYAFRDMGVKTPLYLRFSNNEFGIGSPFTGCFGFAAGFYQEDGVVKFGPHEPAFGEYVKLMKKWYDDGILDKEFADEDSKRRAALATSGENGAMYVSMGSDFGNYLEAIPQGSEIDYVATKIPVRNKGDVPMYAQKNWPIAEYGAAISTGSKHKELAARFLDYGYSEEGALTYNFGKEGESFTYQDGERGSHIPTYTPLVTDYNQNGGLSLNQAMCKYTRCTYKGPFPQSVEYIYQYYRTDKQREALGLMQSNTLDYKLPNLSYSTEEQQRYTDIMTPIDTYRSETLAKLISGKLDISYLDTYFEELKRMGIEEAIQITQDAYDRYIKRQPVTFE